MTHLYRSLKKHKESVWIAVGALCVALGLALAVALGSAGLAGAAVAEVENSTVDVTNETDRIDAHATFANVSDANATADVIVTDPSGAEIANETIDGNGSEVVTWSYELTDADSTGAYGVVLEAPNGSVNGINFQAATASTGGGGGGAGLLEERTGLIVVALIVVIATAVALARRADRR